MPNILVDPVLLTVSEEYTTDSQKAEYLQLLDSWAKEAYSEAGTIYTWHCSGMVASPLHTHRLFPDFMKLQQLKRAHDAVFPVGPAIDIGRIHEWLQDMLGDVFDDEFDLTNPAVEESANSPQVDVEWQATTFQPEEFTDRWHSLIQQEAIHSFAQLCVCAHLKHSYAADLYIATKDFSTEAKGADTVKVDTTMYYLAPPAPPDEESKEPEESEELKALSVSHTFPLLFSPNPSTPPTSPQEWRWGGTESDLRAAIEREYNARYRKIVEAQPRGSQTKQGKNKVTNSANLPLVLTFGSRFLKELGEARQAAHENLPKKLVEAAAAIIAEQAYYTRRFHLKHFRESIGGGTEFRRRGNDIAWRIYVTPNLGGWRLNYWKGPDASGRERVEFSVIQREGDEPKIYSN